MSQKTVFTTHDIFENGNDLTDLPLTKPVVLTHCIFHIQWTGKHCITK